MTPPFADPRRERVATRRDSAAGSDGNLSKVTKFPPMVVSLTVRAFVLLLVSVTGFAAVVIRTSFRVREVVPRDTRFVER